MTFRADPCSCALASAIILFSAACAPAGSDLSSGAGRVFDPIDDSAALLWDRQTTEMGKLLREIVAEFNQNRPGPPVRVEYVGGYGDIYRKVVAGIHAGALPAMAVGYPNMIAKYAQAGAAQSLSVFIHDPETGLRDEDLADFYPGVLDRRALDDESAPLYAFPFYKSVLVLYFNKRVLNEAGIPGPPATWDDFLRQCRRIKAETGKYPVAITVDCSTVSGMIFSRGGEILGAGETLYDAPAARDTFRLLEVLAREDLAFQVPPRTFDDQPALAQDRIAFTLHTSASRPYIRDLMGDEQDKWGIAPIPQTDPERPHTVLYGPEIVIFKTSAEQRRAAWDFVRYFTSAEVNVRWTLATGYLPLRRSAVDDPRVKAMWRERPDNRVPYDCMAFARPEPSIPKWQEIRELVENAETAVLTGVRTADEAVRDLKHAADALLKER